MIYGTYRLPDGTWQAVAAFEDADDARRVLEFQAQGRGWKMAEDPEALADLPASEEPLS